MKNLVMVSATLLAGIAIGVGVDTSAEKRTAKVTPQESLIQFETKLPKREELKLVDGGIKDHVDPDSVVKRAIQAAIDGKPDILKLCFAKSDHESLDEEAWGSEDKMTNLQAISKVFATFDIEKYTILKQNTVGNRAVALVTSELGRHALQLKLRTQENSWGKSNDKEAQKGWFLKKSFNTDQLLVNYADENMSKLREAIKAGDSTVVKGYLEENETKSFQLISGIKEGVDPYELLTIRLQRIMATADRPYPLFQENGNSVAYWFEGEKESAFLVINFNYERNWQTKKVSTKVKVSLSSTSAFFAGEGQTFKNFVSDWGT